jgi:hypothetical protein
MEIENMTLKGSPRVLVERLRLTDQDLEAIRLQNQEKEKGVKRLWRPHEEPQEEQVTSQDEPVRALAQTDSSGPLYKRYCGMSSLYLQIEAERQQEQERSQKEEGRLDEDEDVDVETLSSEVDIKAESLPQEEEDVSTQRPICKIEAVLSEQPLPLPVELRPPEHLYMAPQKQEVTPAVIRLGHIKGPLYVRIQHPVGSPGVVVYTKVPQEVEEAVSDPQPGPSTAPLGQPGPSNSNISGTHKEMELPLPPRPLSAGSIVQATKEALVRNKVVQAIADSGKGKVQHLWDIREIGKKPVSETAAVKELIGKLKKGYALSSEELTGIRADYSLAISGQVNMFMDDVLDNAKRVEAYLALLEVQWNGGLTPPCPTCRRTDKVEAAPASIGRTPQARQAEEPRKSYVGVIIGLDKWIELPSYLNEDWASLPFTPEEVAKMDNLSHKFLTEDQLKETSLFKGLQHRMAQLGKQVEFLILVEYPTTIRMPEGKGIEHVVNFLRIISLIQASRLQPIIVIFPPPQFQALPTTYTSEKNHYVRQARKVRIAGRALGVAVYIPFIQAFIIGTKVALSPRYGTTYVLYRSDGSHSLEMERRIRTSLSELRQAVRPFLVPPSLWTKAQKVAAIARVWI